MVLVSVWQLLLVLLLTIEPYKNRTLLLTMVKTNECCVAVVVWPSRMSEVVGVVDTPRFFKAEFLIVKTA